MALKHTLKLIQTWVKDIVREPSPTHCSLQKHCCDSLARNSLLKPGHRTHKGDQASSSSESLPLPAQSLYLSIHLSIYLSICLCIYQFVYLSIYLSVSLRLSISLPKPKAEPNATPYKVLARSWLLPSRRSMAETMEQTSSQVAKA